MSDAVKTATDADAELKALAAAWKALAKLEDEAFERVIEYLKQRHQAEGGPDA